MTDNLLIVPQLIPENWEVVGSPINVLEDVNYVFIYQGWQGSVMQDILPPPHQFTIDITRSVSTVQRALENMPEAKLYLAKNVPEWLSHEDKLMFVDDSNVQEQLRKCIDSVEIYELRYVDEGYINSLLESVDVRDEEIPDPEDGWVGELEEPDTDEAPFLSRIPDIVDINGSFAEYKKSLRGYHYALLAQAGTKAEIERAKADFKNKSSAAIANWDKASKCPVNDDLPYNKGSNEDERNAISVILFQNEYGRIHALEIEAQQFEKELRITQHELEEDRIEIDRINMILRLLEVTKPLVMYNAQGTHPAVGNPYSL